MDFSLRKEEAVPPIQENTDTDTGKISKKRRLPSAINRGVGVVACLMTLYHLYTAVAGTPNWIVHRPTHVMFFMVIGLITYKSTKKDTKFALGVDIGLALVALLCWVYVMINATRISTFIYAVTPIYLLDKIVIVALMLITVELTRRTTGWALIIVAGFFALQTLYARYFPGFLNGPGTKLSTYLIQMFFTADGFFGTCIGTSATFVFLFIVFGAFLEGTGVGEYFIDLSSDCTRNLRGGAAKCSILASGLFGTISGSAVSNVYATGIFTIPLMKRAGFPPKFAGATEAVASTGGSLMPPVMGSTAFLLADFVGVSYLAVAKAAFLPAILYYVSLWFFIDLEAKKLKLSSATGVPMKHSVKHYLKNSYLFVPMVCMVVTLLVGYSTFMAAFVSICSTLVVALINDRSRLRLKNVLAIMDTAGRTAVSIAAPLACASIVVASIHMTGTGLKLTTMIMRLSGGSLPMAMLLTMLVTVFLGMGLPTPAAYTIVAIFAPTALLNFGVPKLSAHLFCFYYAVLSAITPPVALAAYAGGALAGETATKTGFYAMKLGAVAFVIPWIFVYTNELFMEGSVLAIVWAMVTAVVGVYELASGLQGYCFEIKLNPALRGLLLIGAVCMILPGMYTDAIGVVPLALSWVLNRRGHLARA